MTWKNNIKKKDTLDDLPEGFNKSIGIVIRGLENADLFEYLDEKQNRGMTNSDLIGLLDDLQGTLEKLMEADYDRRTGNI